jgi:ADP-ribose pyrophosphatase YjhB (NUDIX family)
MFCQRCGGKTEIRDHDGRPRPACLDCGAITYLDPKLAVTVIIEREDRILLGKRAEWTRSPGAWSFPAGFVERGEIVESAAIREVREEVGLTVEVGPVLGVLSEIGEPVVLLVFPATSAIGEPVPGDDVTEIGWFSPDDLPELAFDHDPQILRLWQDWRGQRAIPPRSGIAF